MVAISREFQVYDGNDWSRPSRLDRMTRTTSSHTAKAGETILTDTSSGGLAITLPASPEVGDRVLIVDEGHINPSGIVTVAPGSNTIEGVAGNVTLQVKYSRTEFMWTGSTWARYRSGPSTGKSMAMNILFGN